MNKLNIPYQILEAKSNIKIDPETKVVCVSPEKLLDPSVIVEISKLNWSCICIDEPHLALIWGTSKTKHSKPFREAFRKLSRLNNLSTCFELHSATISDESKIFELLGRRNSKWAKQIQLPNRENLTMFVISGNNAPDINNILCLPSVQKAFEDENGLLLLYVQRISDGSSIFLTLLNYCEKNDFITFCPKEEKPIKPIAFLHASLSEEAKRRILSDAKNGKLRVLIATNSAGSGINLPVTHFVGWGLDPEPCGIIQSMGRTCRNPVTWEGAVIWVHNPKIHGRRIPGSSQVRELLKNDACYRKITNSWFSHGLPLDAEKDPIPERCCSWCMEQCVKNNNCKNCSLKLAKYLPMPTQLYNLKSFKNNLTSFLLKLNINESIPETSCSYKEDSLAEEIIKYISESRLQEEESTPGDDLNDFLSIFSLGPELNKKICQFISIEMKDPLAVDETGDELERCDETSSSSESPAENESPSENDTSTEYFDDIRSDTSEHLDENTESEKM